MIVNEAMTTVALEIIKACFLIGKTDINISETGEGEFLIYRHSNGAYNNVIIDSDGDIEFMVIPKDRRDSVNTYYSSIDQLTIKYIADEL